MARPASSTGRSSRRSRRGGGGEDKANAWLTTYADAITLLMAFFVLLYAMSEIDTIKFTAFLEGLRTPFGNEAGDGILPETDGLQPEDVPNPPIDEPMAPIRMPEVDEQDDESDEREREAGDTDADDERDPTDAELREDFIEALERRQRAHDQLDVVAAALDEALENRELSLFVEMRREERGLVVSISSDDVLFALGSTDIGPLGEEVIATVAETLDGFPNPLMVAGHTDDVPLDRGGYTNWNLSTDRAVAVLQLMIDDHDLPPDRVGAVGYGEHHPLETNASDDGRARNRRVDIVVLIEQDEL